MGGMRMRVGLPPSIDGKSRRKDSGEWKSLPAVCDKPVPEWPSFARAEGCAMEKWDEVWHKPQAEIWHNVGMVDLVAVYVKTLVDIGEDSMPPPQKLASLRQQADTLLLTPASLRQQRYVIDGTEDHLKLKNIFSLVEKGELGEDDIPIKRRFRAAPVVDDDAE